MPLTLNLGPRRFVANGWLFLLTVAACVLFVILGFWQWHRGDYRTGVWAQFAHGTAEPLAVTAQTLADQPRFTRVVIEGEYDGARQFLLDNMQQGGRPGYEVLTPLTLADGSVLLINRGWLPFSGYRDRLPDVSLDAPGPQRVTGRIEQLPTAGLASGRAAPGANGSWPKVTTFPSAAEIAVALGKPVLAPVLLLDAAAPQGYGRDWQPPGLSPDRNYSYAIQWWSFAVIALGLFLFLNLEKRR